MSTPCSNTTLVGDAATAQHAEQLQELRPWLLSVCHMAIADASYRLAGLPDLGYGSSAPRAGARCDADDAEASPSAASDALLAALVALPRAAQLQWPPSADTHGPRAAAEGSKLRTDSGGWANYLQMEAAIDTLDLLLRVMQQASKYHSSRTPDPHTRP